ncbi:undecaprenyl-diphosphate phosphatase [Geminicoccus roseus]|uniref:undecaprenyl-diphosphate phosphatase n=1 Tax=Geminicoccus roseus TaxID=404900 RepID=UPI00048417D2|nr:undecaprenyl-diphosphate phosphatase [Geminicoccus roseus]
MESDLSLFQAALLGIVEGLTEFLPVSSTGHLLLSGWLLGVDERFVDLFVVPIQFGAILAVLSLYVTRLWAVARNLPHSAEARRFTLAIILAFLPAAVIGLALHGLIKSLFSHVIIVPIMLILGGILILLIERFHPPSEIHRAEAMTPLRALLIGFCQALAMVPGVSRSGATIMGALVMGVDRRAAAEFSFFLAMPTMLAAASYDLWKQRDVITFDDAGMIAVGFVCAFVSAALVVKALLAFLARNTFRVFGWYRIVVGLIMLAAITLAA